jgi:uncharacterized HAD superfamily protein
MKCTAHLAHDNTRLCQAHAVKGRTKCRKHGGKSPLGPGSGTYKHGRYSRFLPSRLAATYEDIRQDPKLLELRDNIAAVDARLIDLFQRVDTGEAGALWQGARAAMARLKREQSRNNVDGMMVALAEAERWITRGAADYDAWGEIAEQIELRRRLVDSEQKRLVTSHEMLSADRAMLLVSQLVAIVQRHVTDRTVLAAIAADIQGTILLGQERNGSYAQFMGGPDAV